MPELRDLPSVDELLRSQSGRSLAADFGRPLALEAVRQSLETARSTYPQTKTLPEAEQLLQQARETLETWTSLTLRPVINASGVIVHTNLGRAPYSRAAREAVERIGTGYSTLEYNLEQGQRGSRLVHAADLLCRLTGAEDALVVNNNAAAVLLVLTALARGREAVISRTQLVEIGGGFRVPEVMQQSGALLAEIGTTNRVHLADYRRALQADSRPALVMRAHRSNFQIVGFTSEPSLAEIVALSHEYGVPVVDDLGSGSLLDTALFGMAHEPTVQESLQAGADLVCFSGDKLLGGSQAGIIVGSATLVSQLRSHPLARAVRADKLCLAALSATLLHYLKDEALAKVPVWQMIAATPEQLQARARQWALELGRGDVQAGQSTVGGGSLPGETLPTWLLALDSANPNRLLAVLRQADPPVIARVAEDRVVLDPRTVLLEQEPALLEALRQACALFELA
jgi:L-seryl-tRNA(Ser) seleniumtransferase